MSRLHQALPKSKVLNEADIHKLPPLPPLESIGAYAGRDSEIDIQCSIFISHFPPNTLEVRLTIVFSLFSFSFRIRLKNPSALLDIICPFVGRSLMIGWRKKLKPWKGALSSHFHVCLSVCLSVCVCVCGRATGHTFWPRNLNAFFCFSKFSFLRFL